MKTIQINHIAKTEGHSDFFGALLGGDFAEAKMQTKEGARLIEGILLGRKYFEAPIVTARVCGVCPVVHNLTSIKALEQALNVKVTPEIVLLRKIMECGQIIHSHVAHTFFFSLPDLVGEVDNFNLVKKYPKQAEDALAIRHFGVEVCRIIGGRSVHPINSVVGGFNVEPEFGELKYTVDHAEEMIKRMSGLLDFFWKFSIPKFERPTNYISLKQKGDYAIYDGKIYFSDSQAYDTAEGFLGDVRELTQPHERVKRVEHLGQPFMVGALARLNNNADELRPAAQAEWRKLKLKLPCYNSFINIFAQVVEVIHCLEEIKSLFEEHARLRAKRGFETRLKVSFKPNPGKGIGVMEAPRGLLYHEYELDKEGNILHCNIITPTAMFLANLEADLSALLPQIKNAPEAKQKALIKMLIRAYDPCISCATH